MFDDQTSRVAYSARILQSCPFLMSRKFETQRCKWYGVKWITSIFADKEKSGRRFGAEWGSSLLRQEVLISSIQRISQHLFKSFQMVVVLECIGPNNKLKSSSYLFIYQVTSYHKKKLQLPLGLSPKHRNMQFLENQHTNLQSQSDI